MFAIMGIVATYVLPENKNIRIIGIPNRIFFAVGFSIVSVIVEYILNGIGVLTWEYSWWNVKAPWLIFFIGYLPFFVVSFWVYDMKSIKKQTITVSALLAFDAVSLIVFGVVLKWI